MKYFRINATNSYIFLILLPPFPFPPKGKYFVPSPGGRLGWG
jgi:hypothetical protein